MCFYLVSWLAIRDRLSTKERLATRGIGNDSVMCRNVVKNRDHLSFECSFSQRIWRRIKHWSCQDNIGDGWANIVDWAEKNWRVKSMKAVCSKLGFSAAIYHIWGHRNAIIFQGLVRTEDQIVNFIRKQVKFQIHGGNLYASSSINQNFVIGGSLQTLFLRGGLLSLRIMQILPYSFLFLFYFWELLCGLLLVLI